MSSALAAICGLFLSIFLIFRKLPPIFCLIAGALFGGIAGSVLAVGAFLLQGELWTWQMLALSLVAVVSLVIPGYLYKKSFSHGV